LDFEEFAEDSKWNGNEYGNDPNGNDYSPCSALGYSLINRICSDECKIRQFYEVNEVIE